MKKIMKTLSLLISLSILSLAGLASETVDQIKDIEGLYQNETYTIKASLGEKIEEGKTVDLVLSVKNNSEDKLKGSLSLDHIRGLAINEIFEGLKDVDYEIGPGESADFTFKLRPKEPIASDSYPIIINFNYNEYSLIDTVQVAAESSADSDNKPIQDKAMDISKQIGDLPKDPASQESPEKASSGQDVPPNNGQDQPIIAPMAPPASISSGPGPVDTSQPVPGDYIATGAPSLDSLGGDTVQDAGLPSLSSADNVKNKPKLIIDSYSFDPQYPLAGEDFEMGLSFFNTNPDKAVRNIKISLTSNENTLASPKPELLGEGQAISSGGGSVFTPVGSSNTFYIDRIGSKDTIRKSVKLTTPSTIPTGNYQLVANFEYEDYDGNQYIAQETIGIPVMQKAKLSTSDVRIEGEAFMLEAVDGEIQYYNTGKDTLYNLMVKVEGDFEDKSLEEYIGNFKSGNSGSYLFSVTPNDIGNQKGKIVFTYEDATGQTQTLKEDFQVFVSEDQPIPEEELMEEDMNNEFSPPSGPSAFFIIGAVVVAIAIIVAIVQRRKRKSQEEDLKLDED